MPEIESAKLSDEYKKKMEEMERKLQMRAMVTGAYKAYTDAGSKYFLECIDEIEKYIQDEIMKGDLLYTDTYIIARIKDGDSSIENDIDKSIEEFEYVTLMMEILKQIELDPKNTQDYTIQETEKPREEKTKALDDVFGMSIIIAPVYNNLRTVLRLISTPQTLIENIQIDEEKNEGTLQLLQKLLLTNRDIRDEICSKIGLEISHEMTGRELRKEIEELSKKIYDNKDLLYSIFSYPKVLNQFINQTELRNTIIENAARVKICKFIQDKFKANDPKPMKKPEYHAIHVQFYNENENRSQEWPLIEIQIKTEREYEESREHTLYKVESAIERYLRSKKLIDSSHEVKVELTMEGIAKVYSAIQNLFNEGYFSYKSNNIPRMWESRFNKGLAIMERKELSDYQTLKEIYRFLDMYGGRKRGE